MYMYSRDLVVQKARDVAPLCAKRSTPKGLQRRKNNILGQAMVEYVLLVATMTLVFGFLFATIRQNLFKLWVCEMGPRIQSVQSCARADDCFASIAEVSRSGEILQTQALCAQMIR